MDRFELEERINDVGGLTEELETILYKVGDAPKRPSEDELMNMLIGVIELCKVRKERLFFTFETLLKEKKIL
jgi:hypothetical protein